MIYLHSYKKQLKTSISVSNRVESCKDDGAIFLFVVVVVGLDSPLSSNRLGATVLPNFRKNLSNVSHGVGELSEKSDLKLVPEMLHFSTLRSP